MNSTAMVERIDADLDAKPSRSLPANIDAEEELLAAILISNGEALEQVSELLNADHFFDPVHGRIYRACMTLASKGHPANSVTLRQWFDEDGELAEMGGVDFLAYLSGRYVRSAHIEPYANIIVDNRLRRQLITIGEEMVEEGFHPDLELTAVDQIERSEKKLFDLVQEGQIDRSFVPLSDALLGARKAAERAKRRDSHTTGVTTGFRVIDQRLGGLHAGELVVLAGRPGMGKTALATNIATSAARARMLDKSEGAGVAFFSLEMSSEQLAMRLIAEHTGIPSDLIRRGSVEDEDFTKFVTASDELGRYPLFIDDTPALSVSVMRARARRLMRKHGLGLIVIDYLQLMRPTHGVRVDNRALELGEMTRSLKMIAKELNIPVLVLSQLSRSLEQRQDKRPLLSDLRESGAIEQDADVVLFVYREQYYLTNSEPQRASYESDSEFAKAKESWRLRWESSENIAEILIAKHRHGPTGIAKLAFNARLTKFHDLLQQ